MSINEIDAKVVDTQLLITLHLSCRTPASRSKTLGFPLMRYMLLSSPNMALGVRKTHFPACFSKSVRAVESMFRNIVIAPSPEEILCMASPALDLRR